ncbi:hypothetical protein MBLNU13_g08295t2 [Cladosporium sp. NU13]
MSDWNGPSTYVIAGARDTKCHVTLHNGLKADDTKVITWYVNLTSKNDHWDFFFAGHGVSGKEEYLIVCRNSGNIPELRQESQGWSLHRQHFAHSRQPRPLETSSLRAAVMDGTVHDQSMGLALTGGESKDEAVVKTTGRRNDDELFAWCLLLADDAMLNCPDVGKGSF